MPGKCKFQDAWLAKDIYKDWLLNDFQDIHLARCTACCKSIKLQAMGEAALTSHAGGAGHKAAVRKLIEGNIVMISLGEQINGNRHLNEDEDDKEQVALCLRLDPLDRMPGTEAPELHHTANTNSMSHNAVFQEVTSSHSAPRITSPGSSRVTYHHQFIPPYSGRRTEELGRHATFNPHSMDLPGLEQQQQQRMEALEQQQRMEALEQQERMRVLEWKHRMKVLEWEQELLKDKRKAARQKEKAFRMKKRYYRSKLKGLGEEVRPSSSSSSDEDERPNGDGMSKGTV